MPAWPGRSIDPPRNYAGRVRARRRRCRTATTIWCPGRGTFELEERPRHCFEGSVSSLLDPVVVGMFAGEVPARRPVKRPPRITSVSTFWSIFASTRAHLPINAEAASSTNVKIRPNSSSARGKLPHQRGAIHHEARAVPWERPHFEQLLALAGKDGHTIGGRHVISVAQPIQ